MHDRYRAALLDWLACAHRGAREPAAIAARAAGDGLLERVATAGAAGHVLDFDDTYAPGLAHLSAATAPAAVVLGSHLNADVGTVLDAYAAGLEAMGALARTCHPALYDGGWHPTAVCGSAGAAVVAARLLRLDRDATSTAVALALLRAGGLRAAFGADGKALQVGLAAAAGVQAARLAAAGARADAGAIAGGRAGFAQAFGVPTSTATIETLVDADGAIDEIWIKAYPCCLQTHGAIDAALLLRAPPPGGAAVTVTVHPISRQAAAFDDVSDGLEAKFSIPYLTAYALLYGPPGVEDLAIVDEPAALLATRITVDTDPALDQDEALLAIEGRPAARVRHPRGCPANRLDGAALHAKIHALAGTALDGALDDPRRAVSSLEAILAWRAPLHDRPGQRSRPRA